MAKLYLGLNPFSLTNIETLEKTTYSTFDEVMTAAMKKSNDVYTYHLYKLQETIANYLYNKGYEVLDTIGKDIDFAIKKNQFYTIGSAEERTCIYIKARRTTEAQLKMYNVKGFFGKATELDIASTFGCEEDVETGMCFAIDWLLSQGHTSYTLAGNAFKDLKNECFGKKLANGKFAFTASNYDKMFPKLDTEVHNFVMKNFQNGLCIVNEEYVGTTVMKGKSFDVNSMYPAVMKQEYLPYGTPEYFTGKLEYTGIVLHFQRIRIQELILKVDGIPCLRNEEVKDYYKYGKELELVLSHVGLEMLFDNYTVKGIEYVDGYKFHGRKGMFDTYIDKWMEVKKNAEDGSFERMYAKLMLNSAFGKFVSRNNRRTSYWDTIKRGPLKGTLVRKKSRSKDSVEGNTVYAPVGCYITDYARQRLIAAIKANKENFIYSDTDSIYVEGEAQGIEIDSKKLGAWKEEFEFEAMTIIGKKQYCVLKSDDTLKVTLAGCPDIASKQIADFFDFCIGKEINYTYKKFDLQGNMVEEPLTYVINEIDIDLLK